MLLSGDSRCSNPQANSSNDNLLPPTCVQNADFVSSLFFPAVCAAVLSPLSPLSLLSIVCLFLPLFLLLVLLPISPLVQFLPLRSLPSARCPDPATIVDVSPSGGHRS